MKSTERIEILESLVGDALDLCGRDPVPPIAPDTFLPDFLDSVVLSSLLVLIEERWDIEIADEEIEPEKFETLAAISSFVSGKTGSDA